MFFIVIFSLFLQTKQIFVQEKVDADFFINSRFLQVVRMDGPSCRSVFFVEKNRCHFANLRCLEKVPNNLLIIPNVFFFFDGDESHGRNP